MRVLRTLWLAIFALMLLGATIYSNAQQGDATCPLLIEQALQAIDNNCGDLSRNTACYGYQAVNATFTEPTAPDFFSAPSDRAQLVTLKNIGTSPMDTLLEKWGIALLSLQANLPDTLPGQNAVFMLLGDTEVENAVPPEDVFSGDSVIDVTIAVAAGQFYLPDTSSRIVGAIPENAVLSADAITRDNDWVRVVYEGVPGWVTRAVLAPQDNLDSLPILTPEMRTPMQAFYLRTGITGTQCTEAPDSLIVQGPQNLTVDINANGADIRLGSTIALRLIPLTPEVAALFAPSYSDIDQVTVLLELVVIDGQAILNPGTPDALIVEEGFRTVRCLANPDNLGLDGVDNDRAIFSACRWLAPDRWREIDYNTYGALEGVELNYVIHLPDLPAPTPTSTWTPQPVIILPRPTLTPSETPTTAPTLTPSITATVIPFDILTDTPTTPPTDTPTIVPEDTAPTDTPTTAPTDTPTVEITQDPNF